MSNEDVGRQLRRFRGYINRDEAFRTFPPDQTSNAPSNEPPSEDNSNQDSMAGLALFLYLPDLIYGILLLIGGLFIGLKQLLLN